MLRERLVANSPRLAQALQQARAQTPGSLTREIELNRILLGTMMARQFPATAASLRDVEFRVFSQYGDDGIIQYLIHHVDVARQASSSSASRATASPTPASCWSTTTGAGWSSTAARPTWPASGRRRSLAARPDGASPLHRPRQYQRPVIGAWLHRRARAAEHRHRRQRLLGLGRGRHGPARDRHRRVQQRLRSASRRCRSPTSRRLHAARRAPLATCTSGASLGGAVPPRRAKGLCLRRQQQRRQQRLLRAARPARRSPGADPPPRATSSPASASPATPPATSRT